MKMNSPGGLLEKRPIYSEVEVTELVSAKKRASWLASHQEKAVINLLIDECAEDLNIKEIVLKLLEKFEVIGVDRFSHSMIHCMEYFSQFIADDNRSTVIFGFCEKSAPDGSSIPLNLMRRLGLFANVKSKIVNIEYSDKALNIPKIIDVKRSILNVYKKTPSGIVVLDDFIGSGTKVYGYLRAIRALYPEASLALYSMISMKSGFDFLRGKQRELGYVFGCGYVPDSNSLPIISGAESVRMIDFERSILRVSDEYVGGYKNSQATCVIAGHAISNNVYPLFWWNKNKFRAKNRPTLFSRKK